MDTGKVLIPLSAGNNEESDNLSFAFLDQTWHVLAQLMNAYIWLGIDLGIILKNSLIIHSS
jgi:hypothetical protein